MGGFVPAKSACLGPLDRIFTRIGAGDNVSQGQSTFMVEMTEASAIMHQATARSLILMDEIGRGTSTTDGLSLAYAFAKHLADTIGALTLFATHYFELTELAHSHSNMVNRHFGAIEHQDTIVFMYQIQEGAATQSYGLQVAKLAGVPLAILQEAEHQLALLKHNSKGLKPTDTALEKHKAALVNSLAPDPAVQQILSSLKEMDLSQMNPKSALDWLYEQQDLLKAQPVHNLE
jgi:DNA mismatch repair protein MutS